MTMNLATTTHSDTVSVTDTWSRVADVLGASSLQRNAPVICSRLQEDALLLGMSVRKAFLAGEINAVEFATIVTELPHHPATAMPFRQGLRLASQRV